MKGRGIRIGILRHADSDDAIRRTVRRESLRAVFEQMPLTLGVSALNAAVVATVLLPRLGPRPVLVWLAAFALMLGLRTVTWRRFLRLPADAALGGRWEAFSVGGAFFSGALWGACVAWLMPAEAPYPLFIAFVVAGMSAAGALVNSTHLLSLIAFLLPTTLPLAAWLLRQGGGTFTVLAAMTLWFAAGLAIAAWRFNAVFTAGIAGRIALRERTEQLAEANERLRAEIEERRETEAALRQAQKMEAIGSLTAGVAHDFNNLLMVIRGGVELLQRRIEADSPAQRSVSAILRAAERGAGLTRQLLAFARQETLQPAAVDLNAVIRGVEPLLGASLGKSVQVTLELAEELRPVFVDSREIERAIVNLAINARDAMPEGGVLTLRTENLAPAGLAAVPDLAPGQYVVLSVSDTGGGMTEDVRSRAFDPFFTTKPQGRGSGLGLSQVYGLVKQSGGTTWIESTVGLGTTIRLYLLQAADPRAPPVPLHEAAAPDPQPPPVERSPAETARHHIALLDDEEMVRDVLAEVLLAAGHQVSFFATAADALAFLERDPSVALLITDYAMPDVTGDQVATLVRRLRPGLPVLFVTGYNDKGLLAGERWVLRKPFSAAELLATIGRMLARSTTGR